jgi:hypothetical protein
MTLWQRDPDLCCRASTGLPQVLHKSLASGSHAHGDGYTMFMRADLSMP